ncbi:hypothetical protein QCA50_007318 [Cerrena zonata]|uniref:Serine/threonine-protein phosphatase n=1 Tax=Cerrena zonata TaxID=2478898 RepID=A0AAW0G849_9APHY
MAYPAHDDQNFYSPRSIGREVPIESVPYNRPNTPERIAQRQVETVDPPYTHIPTDEEFYMRDPRTGILKPNVDMLRDHFFHEGRLTEQQALFILEQTTEVMRTEPNLLRMNGPVVVCGDIHGQYYDLMKIFDVGGPINKNPYLFLGDYVDRGCFGIECLLYLYALKLWYPKTLWLLRGNHECAHLTAYFTFKRECLHKYSETVYDACVRSFYSLPLTALIDGKFFCVHGGISPELVTLSDLDKVDRYCEPASSGLLCDLLWADPMPNFGHEQEPSYERPNGVPPGTFWEHNNTRGCSYYYTYEAVVKFIERNHLLGIFRGHEAQDAGYTMHRRTPSKKFPSVITIFSAPNYLDVYHNRGAVIRYKDRNITIRQFNASQHPYWLPNFMDAFTWSLPFVGSKITEMLLAILSICTEDELEDDSSSMADEDDTRTLGSADSVQMLSASETAARRQQIKNKILAVGKMQKVFQLLREEAETATELTTSAPTPLPTPVGVPEAPTSWPGGFVPDALGVHVNELKRQIRSFDDARKSDMLNERMPTFTPSDLPLVPVPSMKLPRFARSQSLDVEGGGEEDGGGISGAQSMEALIRKALEEEGLNDGGVVERIAERISRGSKASSRPSALRRFDTVA